MPSAHWLGPSVQARLLSHCEDSRTMSRKKRVSHDQKCKQTPEQRAERTGRVDPLA